MFYCDAAYDGLMEAQICVGVCDGSLRPKFNNTCPLAFQKLATQCWAQNPEERQVEYRPVLLPCTVIMAMCNRHTAGWRQITLDDIHSSCHDIHSSSLACLMSIKVHKS